MWVVGGAFPGVAAAAVGQRRGWPTVFLRAVSADQCGFSCAVISRRLPKLVESLIAPKLLLTALFSFLSRQSYLRYIFFFFCIDTRAKPSSVLLNLPADLSPTLEILSSSANSQTLPPFFLHSSSPSIVGRELFLSSIASSESRKREDTKISSLLPFRTPNFQRRNRYIASRSCKGDV